MKNKKLVSTVSKKTMVGIMTAAMIVSSTPVSALAAPAAPAAVEAEHPEPEVKLVAAPATLDKPVASDQIQQPAAPNQQVVEVKPGTPGTDKPVIGPGQDKPATPDKPVVGPGTDKPVIGPGQDKPATPDKPVVGPGTDLKPVTPGIIPVETPSTPGFPTWPSTGTGFGTWPSTGTGFGTWPSTGTGFGTWPSTGTGFGTWPSIGYSIPTISPFVGYSMYNPWACWSMYNPWACWSFFKPVVGPGTDVKPEVEVENPVDEGQEDKKDEGGNTETSSTVTDTSSDSSSDSGSDNESGDGTTVVISNMAALDQNVLPVQELRATNTTLGTRTTTVAADETDDSNSDASDAVTTESNQNVKSSDVEVKKEETKRATLGETQVPLAAIPTEAAANTDGMNWMWLLLVFFLGSAGVAMYENYKKKAQADQAKKN